MRHDMQDQQTYLRLTDHLLYGVILNLESKRPHTILMCLDEICATFFTLLNDAETEEIVISNCISGSSSEKEGEDHTPQ